MRDVIERVERHRSNASRRRQGNLRLDSADFYFVRCRVVTRELDVQRHSELIGRFALADRAAQLVLLLDPF